MIPEELLTLQVPPLGELIRQGQALMIPLLVLFGLSLTIILDRTLFWAFAGLRILSERNLLRRFAVGSAGGSLKGFLETVYPGAKTAAFLTQSFFSTVLVTAQTYPDNNKLWEDEMDRVVGRSERFLSFLTLIATLGTSFGLLGTVIGVSTSLKYIESDFSATVSGLSVALYTTIGGLVISIISLTAYGIFSSFSDSLTKAIVAAVNTLEKNGASPPKPVPAPTVGLSKPFPGRFERKEDTLAVSPQPQDLSSGDIVIDDL